MVGGSWLNNDGLYIQYGTQKAVPEVGGDYLSYGETRDIEFTVVLSTLTTTPTIISNTTFFPLNGQVFIESVNVDMETAAAGGTSFSVGLMGLDRSTITPSPYGNTTLVNAMLLATMTAGSSQTLTGGSTGAGTIVGTQPAAATQGAGYITCTAAGTFTGTGTAKVRIRYRGIGTITQ
jgi:hypothetical protein